MSTPPRIEYLRVKNFRALRDVELKDLTPLTVFLGPNGSGKSTLFDVFAFLSECFTDGLRKALDKRNRFKELRTRGQTGPIEIELKYREPGYNLITYHLAIDEGPKGPFVAEESLTWRRKSHGKPFKFLDFREGAGMVITGDLPEESDARVQERLTSPDVLAVNTLGQFAKHPRVSALRNFVTGWYVSYLSADAARGIKESGPQERLTAAGDNLSNVIQHMREQDPGRLARVVRILGQRVPRLENVLAEELQDGRLLLQIKDAPFERPILAKFASDGTLKLLAYLIVLHDPTPPQLIGIEEPENYLHPKLLRELAEECRNASASSQLLVTTHSPFFVNGLRERELWVVSRDDQGFTRVERAADMPGISAFMQAGAALGDLWMEGRFTSGDPFGEARGAGRR